MSLTRWLLALFLLAQISTGFADDPYRQDREQFLKAYNALERGATQTFAGLEPELRDYPLYPYLIDKKLRRHLSTADDEAIADFLTSYPDTPLAQRLRQSWLHRLGRQRAWGRYRRFYTPQSSVTLQCYHLRSIRPTPLTDAWLDQVEALWLVGHSQPDACDPAFDFLYQSGRITPAKRWQRIEQAMANRKLTLARYLARELPAADQADFRHWVDAHKRPSTLLAQSPGKDTPRQRKILVHALKRLAGRDPAQAERRWQKLWDHYPFTEQQRAEVLQAIGLNAAFKGLPDAYDWLAAIPRQWRNQTVQSWLVRSALKQRDWNKTLKATDSLDAELARKPEWRYWQAAALEQLQHPDQARPLFTELAGLRNYHGFLAADRMQLPYQLTARPIAHTEQELTQLRQQHPGLVRAHELLLINHNLQARREWYAATRHLGPRELELAAVLAHRWGWHDRAIISAAEAKALDDLELRFPLAHQQQVQQTASRYQLDPAWIFGVMRQESAFMSDARSPVGALGLMQLMPATGRLTAKQYKLPRPSTHSLLQAGTNIQIGSGYLKRVLDRFNNNTVLATAAYNAGPHRVDAWLPDESTLPADIWVDTLPFKETRGYVRAVLAFTTVYDQRLDGVVTPLARRMPTIPNKH